MDEAAIAVSLLFLDCDDEVLGRRFTETRRRHPLADDRPPIDGIRLERQLVHSLRDRADFVIDTSLLTPHELRRVLLGQFGRGVDRGMAVLVTSFSYRYGLPREADLVLDVRFLRNPHYDPALRPLTGRDAPVADHIRADPDCAPFLDHLRQLFDLLLPRYEREGKSYLTIAVGCTGGKHRSVFVAEEIGVWVQKHGLHSSVIHRDLERGEAAEAARLRSKEPA
jgi:UPF0042 nucleotide-binding protein